MRALLPFVVAGVLCAAGPQPAATTQAVNARPDRAVVFIRLLGQIELDPPPSAAITQALREGDVELGTGSGFLFSAYGHVLTCAHVLRAEPFRVLEGGMPIEVKPTVQRIEVLLPAAEGEPAPAPFEATVLATDNDLDLAVLSIGSSGMPYLHLGDSEAVEGGDAVEAMGFPFGRRLEIGRPAGRSAGVPGVSVTRGNVSASRLDAQGERRYLQTTAALNAGNSGGPILDADGYAVGIANSIFTVRNAPTGVGFAVPIDLAKRFLQAHSLDGLLEARPISLGAPGELEGKGIRLTLPYGLADRSPVRSRVDTGGESDPILLRVDRVLSPWAARRLAETLTNGEAFEAFSATGAPTQKVVESRGRGLLLGRVAGTLRGWGPVRMEYAVLDLGVEKVVARYIASPHQAAFAASALRASLKSLEAQSLRPAGREASGRPAWVARAASRRNPLDRVAAAEGWAEEPVAPYRCSGVPAASDAVSQSPLDNFAFALRAGWVRAAGDGAAAASACGGRGESGDYEREVDALGTRYLVIGQFVPLPSGELLQMEGSAPVAEGAGLRAVFSAWIARLGPS
jgi:S1-C subfamily serine protease